MINKRERSQTGGTEEAISLLRGLKNKINLPLGKGERNKLTEATTRDEKKPARRGHRFQGNHQISSRHPSPSRRFLERASLPNGRSREMVSSG